MTKKLPRRWSKRVVIYDAGGDPSSTREIVKGTADAPRDRAISGSKLSGGNISSSKISNTQISGRALSGSVTASDAAAEGEPFGDALPPSSSRPTPRAPEPPGSSPTVVSRRRRVVPFEAPHATKTGSVATGGGATSGVTSSGVTSSGVASSGVAPVPLAAPPPVARALVVDDDPEIRRALARLLRPELDVHLAGSVAQAEVLLEHLDRVDVAFIDWELPDGTGEQILERLAHWPDAIRVLISARVSTSENPLKNRALANLVLGKPLALGVIEALKRAALALPQD